MGDLRKTEMERDSARERARKEKEKFRYSEPPTDRNARSIVDPEYVTAQPLMQRHDGSFAANSDDLNFQPVQLPTAAFYDPASQVLQHDQSMGQMWPDPEDPAKNDDSQKIDFDRIMHENFQYENTMNKAHLNRFTKHTGELMFSRAGMRHFHFTKLQ